MNSQTKRFITCGMYAFTDSLRRAWQALFDEFWRIHQNSETIDQQLRFDTDFELLRQPQMQLGHTCGYPLMKYLQTDCFPVCVPLFLVEGCHGKFYASHFIVPADSGINSLADCRNHIVAMNGADSNSGMNVLRHAISQLETHAPFFSSVLVSGSHLNSVKAVANGEADLAAIDGVSFALINDEWPELTRRVKTIGFSEATCGLPLVMPYSEHKIIRSRDITRVLNQALSALSTQHKNTLHLAGFESVGFEDYQSIIDLETSAITAGYPQLA